ncbi:MAG TPA: hypothetical protein VMY35_08030 [Phycisphaerae bacterium]|nr:hypothetical protein [Phycisphaerae bacterium]
MPIALEAGETFKYVLRGDRNKPAESRPAFIFEYVTARQARAIARPLHELEKSDKTGTSEAFDALFKAIRANLVGWENMRGRDGKDIPFAASELDAIVTLPEAWELYYGAHAGQRLDASEKNVSASPSDISSEISAPAAPATGATAKTP